MFVLALPQATLAASGMNNHVCHVDKSEVETQLYFGLSKNIGGAVSIQDFNKFIKMEILPVFPAGFTIIPSQGYWLGKDGKRVFEKSIIIIVVHKKNPQINHAIERIRSDYTKKYAQDSVMRTDHIVCASF